MSAESYVVRIYRREARNRDAVIGVVEAMPTGWQKPFRSLAELTAILAEARAGPPAEGALPPDASPVTSSPGR